MAQRLGYQSARAYDRKEGGNSFSTALAVRTLESNLCAGYARYPACGIVVHYLCHLFTGSMSCIHVFVFPRGGRDRTFAI